MQYTPKTSTTSWVEKPYHYKCLDGAETSVNIFDMGKTYIECDNITSHSRMIFLSESTSRVNLYHGIEQYNKGKEDYTIVLSYYI